MEYNEVNELEGEWFCNECVYRKKEKVSVIIAPVWLYHVDVTPF